MNLPINLFGVLGFLMQSEETLRPSVHPLPGYEKFYQTQNISFLYNLDAFDITIISLYFGILFVLSLYGIYRLKLVYLFWRYVDHKPKPKSQFAALPRVTVQLPLFNEMYVVERLLKAVTELDYPQKLIEIQVLDDSTDETAEIAARAVERYRNEGF